jgi:hypothetical protein
LLGKDDVARLHLVVATGNALQSHFHDR